MISALNTAETMISAVFASSRLQKRALAEACPEPSRRVLEATPVHFESLNERVDIRFSAVWLCLSGRMSLACAKVKDEQIRHGFR